jgi:hypothetical protein
MPHVGYFFDPVAAVDTNFELLTMESWFPPANRPITYAFAVQAAPLLPFYEGLVGYHRVEPFGRAFLVHFEPGDWSWLRQHGWAYEALCRDVVVRGEVPTLFQPRLDFRDIRCDEPITVTWRGRWSGPAARLRLLFSGKAVVETSGNPTPEKAGEQTAVDFSVEPDKPITVTVTDHQPLWAALVELTPAGQRLPPWERVNPLPSPSAADHLGSVERGLKDLSLLSRTTRTGPTLRVDPRHDANADGRRFGRLVSIGR